MTNEQENTQVYDTRLAAIAQHDFCNSHNVPRFADTYCYHCGRDIYSPGGYTVASAGNTLITSCPFCHTSYVD